jgi:hypothetical protein
MDPFCGYITRIPGQLKESLRESLEMAVERLRRDGKKGIRLCKEDFEIRCQDTTSED